MLECAALADEMESPDEAPDAAQQPCVVQLWSASAVEGVEGEAERAVTVQCHAVDRARRNDRDLRGRELGAKPVLLEDGRIAPAPRPVEFCDDRRRVLETDAVDAVLVAREREQPPVAARPERLDGGEDVVRPERLVSERVGDRVYSGVPSGRAGRR